MKKSETNKQRIAPNFQIGDKVIVTKVRDDLSRPVGATATVIDRLDISRLDLPKVQWDKGPSDFLEVQWDDGCLPVQQRCWSDQFEIVTQIKVMDDTSAYLEAINNLTQGSSNE